MYIATYHLLYDNGIGIIDIEYGIEDYVIFQYFCSEKRDRKSRAKIRYNSKGEPFFNSFHKRYYLNQFLRSDLQC